MDFQYRADRGEPPHPTGSFFKFTGEMDTNPYREIDRFIERPIFWANDVSDVDGYWVATRYEDVKTILQDTDRFGSFGMQVPYNKLSEPLLPTDSNPPRTQELRAILMPLLTAKKATERAGRMEELCRSIIGTFRDAGNCELISQFSQVYPTSVFLEIFGLSPDRCEEFRNHADNFLHHPKQRPAEWDAILSIIRETIVAKRAAPSDDLLSAIANAQLGGELIDLSTATSLGSTVFLGGLDTLPSNIGWSFKFLAEHPDYRQRLIDDPSLIPGAVEELLRVFAVSPTVRTARQTMEFGGANMVAGDRILCSLQAANRSPEVFGPGFSFERRVNPHMTFATGPHRCLGSHLARHELGIALRIWHELIPHYRIPEGTELKYRGAVLAIDELPLEWDV